MIKTFPIFLPHDKIAWITAGPTSEMPPTHKLIRCAAEIEVDPDNVAFDIATGDFKPFDEDKVLENLQGIIEALLRGEKLYAGCMGGTGRTGTILAIIAAQHPEFTYEDAILYIRAIYKSHAVETSDQAQQVFRLSHIYQPPMRPEMINRDLPWWKKLLGLS